MSNQSTLIARVLASEGDRDLDLEVMNALCHEPFWRWHDRTSETITRDIYGPGAAGNPICSLERFTASIDDAASAIPDNFHWMAGRGKSRPEDPLYGAIITDLDGNEVAQAGNDISVASCLCAAMLKVRAP